MQGPAGQIAFTSPEKIKRTPVNIREILTKVFSIFVLMFILYYKDQGKDRVIEYIKKVSINTFARNCFMII